MLLDHYISDHPHPKMLVLFGGNPVRRDEVIRNLSMIPNLSIMGTLSEQEGLEAIETLPKVDIVLIGGRYSIEQRIRIKSFIHQNYPHIQIEEPGIDYPYDEQLIHRNIQRLVK